MDTFDIPIYKKTFELYKLCYLFGKKIAKQDRFTIWLRCENLILDIVDCVLLAAQLPREKKLPELEKMSLKLNFLRVILRMTKEVKIIDTKRYSRMELIIDEIGRMLGGWIKSAKAQK